MSHYQAAAPAVNNINSHNIFSGDSAAWPELSLVPEQEKTLASCKTITRVALG